MKTEDILTIEEDGENRINLVRDRLFWQAWNRSAFLFVTHIKKYHVHKRFVQKVSREVAWLGFPKSALDKIEQTAREKGWTFEKKSADHIVIDGVPCAKGYEKWWADIVKPIRLDAAERAAKAADFVRGDNNPQLLPAYKVAYDLCLNVHRSTAKMPKEFRYELGARVRNCSVDIAETLHLMNNISGKRARPSDEAVFECANMVHKLRICIRILSDLRQIGVNQWGFLNKQIEDLLNLLRAEFCGTNTKTAEATHIQSGGTGRSPVRIAGGDLGLAPFQ